MKKILILFSFFALTLQAQIADPVVMIVNGEKISRSAFEYAYNKNRTETSASTEKEVKDYAELFLNYQLKVAAARAVKMDTLQSYRREFQKYRNQLLAASLIDSQFIDSVAISLYERMAKRVGEKGLFRTAHILIALPQQTSDAVVKKGFLKADSLSQLLQQGTDFAALAKQHSDDPGSAAKGGELPWLSAGETLEEFEHQVSQMKVGETSAPFLTPAGYHIVRLLERKPLDDYATIRPQIIASLQRQGIEEASAEQRIQRMVKASRGKLTREAILDSVYQANAANPEIAYLIKEYEDGLLLFEASDRFVWKKAQADTEGLTAFFKKNRRQYAWTEPRFKGFVYLVKDKKWVKPAKNFIQHHTAADDWRQQLKATFNQAETNVALIGPLLVKAGEDGYVDQHVFKGVAVTPHKDLPITGVVGRKLKQPQSYDDVRDQVVEDYQKELEAAWVAQLRQQIPYQINTAVLRTVNQH